MSSTAGAFESRSSQSAIVARELAAVLCLALVLLSFALSLFLTWRRIVGALVVPLGAIPIVLAATGLVVTSTVLRSCSTQCRHVVLSTEYLVLVRMLPGVGAVMLLAALTLPGTPPWGIAAAWLLLIACETTSWYLYRRGTAGHPTRTDSAQTAVAESELPSGLMQRITRVREADRESLHALVQTEIEAGDNVAVVHLAFCPPLAERPQLTAHALDSDGADVRIAQVETFGARIVVRLPHVEPQPRQVMIEVLSSVTCPPDA